MGWEAVVDSAKDGGTIFLVAMGAAAKSVPLGESVSIVLARIRTAQLDRKIADDLADELMTSIRRNEATLQQLQENQLHDQSKHKPILKLLQDYVVLLGDIEGVCRKWEALNCLMQMCFSSQYKAKLEQLNQDMGELRGDLLLGAVAKIDAEARIHTTQITAAVTDLDTATTRRHEETTEQLHQSAQRQNVALQRMKDIKSLLLEGETNAATLTMTAEWDSIIERDWDAKAPGTVSDAARAIAVGLSDRPGHSQKLLIQIINTEEEYDYNYLDWDQVLNHRPVWSIALSASDLEEVMKSLKVATQDIVLHEEPFYSEDEKWHIRASWIPLDECQLEMMQLRLSVKVTQNEHPTVHRVRFVAQGKQLRRIGEPQVETIVGGDGAEKLAAAFLEAKKKHPTLPTPSYKGPEPLVFSSTKKEIDTDFLPEGDSGVEIELDLQQGRTMQRSSTQGGVSHLYQLLLSGRMVVRNPTKEKLRIRQVYAETKEGNQEDFHMCDLPESKGSYVSQSATSVGLYKGKYMNWGIEFPEVDEIQGSFEIPPEESLELVVQATHVVPNTESYKRHPFDLRLHDSIVDPVTVRATFVDAHGKTKSICWQYANDPLEYRNIASYEDLLALPADDDPSMKYWEDRELDHVGDKCQCDLWLQVDDPLTLERTYLVITTAKENPHRWVVRSESPPGCFPLSCTYVTPSELKRLVYDARKAKKSVMDLTDDWSMSDECNFRVLVDLEMGVAYALEAEICLEGAGITAKKSIYLDQDRVRPEKDDDDDDDDSLADDTDDDSDNDENDDGSDDGEY